MDFNEYYDAVCDALSAKGYQAAPDRDTVEEDWKNGHSVDDCVEGFADDWGDPGDEEIE